MLVSSRGKIIEFWSRAHTGPICFAQDFDTKVYWPKLKAITKKWGITYDPSQMIPCDDDLLDRNRAEGFALHLPFDGDKLVVADVAFHAHDLRAVVTDFGLAFCT